MLVASTTCAQPDLIASPFDSQAALNI